MEVVLASRNAGKLTEMQTLLAPLSWTLRLLSDYTDQAAVESASSFVENALIKARHAAQVSGLPAIADDSGLEVAALNGAPGVYSARYAGHNASDADNNAKLLDALEGLPEAQRTARFVCVLSFMRHAADPTPVIAEGCWRGRILDAARGTQGFGYDPLFFVPEHHCSSAELAPALKNRCSHRALAAATLLARLQSGT
ncbi:MAG: Xanthosine triphosphate pyrophosphatase [Hydrocarboniphaga sp.]|uniref:RdgB/HAM1 family non-canonical purine NTP pyrophosphatase n=1 Tax=Hydrocarboniphaga sp. TaxID=2033016 RepID=UPI00262D87CF|nr:RdgB/HAM1 family non-canonical purine NTP pyrophosphatase [Hydrocarboniphaga sp.]MDB5972024.1 Xanthosine triphosphate pyrophosphatase [Hydrocarboniphaga sp.]